MNAKQRRYAERAQRSVLYMEAEAEAFPDGNKAATTTASIKDELNKLNEFEVARQTGGGKRQQGTAGRRSLRGKLRELTQSTSNTAETIALDRPDLKGIFSLAGVGRSDQILIATARAFADAAAPVVGLFVEYGMKATLVNDLRSLADSLDHYMELQTDGLRARGGSNLAVEATLQRINLHIERLDTIVRNTFRDDPAKLAAWERAIRIESAPHAKDPDANTPPTEDD